MLGGKIYLEETTVGKGTTFAIVLPVKSVKALTDNSGDITGEDKNKLITYPDPKKMESHRILYVEDERSSIALVKAYLKNYCRLDIANTAPEAIEKVKSNKYSVILMDKTPIVAITAFAMEKEKEEFLKRGCSHYISKPFEKHNFISMLNHIFDGQ
jgi:CheY-like chemotaxis protein